MKRLALFLLVLSSFVPAACSSSSSAGGGAGADPAGSDADASGDDRDRRGPDDAGSDGAPAKDAALDSATSPKDAGALGPQPPSGSTPCGSGTFTQAQAFAACQTPSVALDTMNPTERHCDAVTITGGSWQAWCSSGPVYVWAELEGVTSTGAWKPCKGTTEMMPSHGWIEIGGGGSGMTARPSLVTFDTSKPADVAFATLGNTAAVQSGTANLFFLAEGSLACSPAGNPVVVSGVQITFP